MAHPLGSKPLLGVTAVVALLAYGLLAGAWLAPQAPAPLRLATAFVPDEFVLPKAMLSHGPGSIRLASPDLQWESSLLPGADAIALQEVNGQGHQQWSAGPGRHWVVAAWGGTYWVKAGQWSRTSLDMPSVHAKDDWMQAGVAQVLHRQVDGQVWILDLAQAQPQRAITTDLPGPAQSLTRDEQDRVVASGGRGRGAWTRAWDEGAMAWVSP